MNMKKQLFQEAFYLFLFIMILSSCSSHPCVKNWEGEFKRQGQNTWETWKFNIKNDGTCTAIEEGRGDANYKMEYYGTWEPVSDEIIYLDLETGQRVSRYTIGYVIIRTRMSNHKTGFYINKDGAADPFMENLSNPRIWLK